MISAEVASVLNRLRGQGSDLEFIADVLTDALAAQNADFVGYMKLSAPETTAEVHPPDYWNLNHDLPATLTVEGPGFMKPGDTGASGGCTMRVFGPNNFTPRRSGDVTIWSPDGTVVCKRLFVDGKEVRIEDCT